MKPSVAVVILNWNGKHWLEKFLPGVMQTAYNPLSIIVGDNASTDDSVQYIKSNFPDVEIIINDQNYGFAEGYNRVLEQVEADYFVLLNSDVEVTKHWIAPVIELMESDDLIAAAQPKIKAFNDPLKFEYAGAAGGFIDAFGYTFCRGRIFDHTEVDRKQYDIATDIFWASGAAFFVKKKYWIQYGGFDVHLFAHMEEIDVCWRLQNHGLKIAYCPDAEVFHVGGGTLHVGSPHKTYLNFRNNLVIMLKNLPFGAACWKIFIRLFLDLFALIKFLVDGKPALAAAVSKAHRNFFLNWRRTYKQRGDILKPFTSLHGVYRRSIVFSYFLRKIKTFEKLKF